ncbi:MAG: hypothetical protein DRO98_08470 [Archaeoglobales archaeon]|nr:MAG: hypothetical protein DRO98_08470 [Archaeoglobales archaeon]
MSPEWTIHRKWGELLCRFSEPEIDKLIDLKQHDAGRYDPSILKEQLDYVRRKWGGVGVYYYILHHLLDRAEDILLSELSSKLDAPQTRLPSPDKFTEELLHSFKKRFEEDSKSLITCLEETQWFYEVFSYKGALCALVRDIINRERFREKLTMVMLTKSVARYYFPKKPTPPSAIFIAEYVEKIVEELCRCVEEEKEKGLTKL